MQQGQRATLRQMSTWQAKATSNIVPASRAFVTGVGPSSRRHSSHYLQAVRLAREQQFDDAREVFALCTAQQPEEEIAWVSWAQMEKRTEAMTEDESTTRRFARSRAVLQQGLQLNPHSARICQAWGLLELQAGNMWAALALLERATRADARCAPVLRWQPVQAARLAVSQRRQHVSRSKLGAKLRSIA